jgi:hypothetical protein
MEFSLVFSLRAAQSFSFPIHLPFLESHYVQLDFCTIEANHVEEDYNKTTNH